MEIVALQTIEKTLITDFFVEHWGSPEMVISSGTYRCDELDGFAALNEEQQEIIGLITFIVHGEECEVISLDSLREGHGIGSCLLREVESLAVDKGCRQMKLITTNDNLKALGFYQKRGYRLLEILHDAVESAREKKPEIPLVGENGIQICDEILLGKMLFK